MEHGHYPFASWVILVAWRYDFGNLGSDLVDCTAAFQDGVTCTLIANNLDCDDPNDCTIQGMSADCGGVGNVDDCYHCEDLTITAPWWAWPDIDVPQHAPRVLEVTFSGVAFDACPNCDPICNDPDCDCGSEPTCNDPSFCDCVNYCETYGWDSAEWCLACWEACDPEYPDGCYAEWDAYITCTEDQAYIDCQAACDECQECEDCADCESFNSRTFRLVGGGDAGTSTCFWNWYASTNCPAVCIGTMDINRMRFELSQSGTDLVGTLYLRQGVTDIVTFTKTICSACRPSFFVSTFDCLSWAGESDGWTISVEQPDINLCDWTTYALSVAPLAPNIICQTKPSKCPCDGGTPDGLPRYMLMSIDDHWVCGSSCADCRCDLAVGDFLLEYDPTGCRWSYSFDGPDACTHVEDPCCWDSTNVYMNDTGSAIRIVVDVRSGNHVVTWRHEEPYKYPSGADVIDCFDAIDNLTVPFCSQSGHPSGTSYNYVCQWNGDTTNLGPCRPADAPGVTLTAYAVAP